MRFLADETIELIIVNKLHDAGHDVLRLPDRIGEFSQDDIIQLAQQEQAILLTDNKDFNKRYIKTQPTLPGIVVLLFEQEEADVKVQALLDVIQQFGPELASRFTLITPNGVESKPREKNQLTPAAFDLLLACLDPDRERAGEKYEEIRHKLISLLRLWGSPSPEDQTDEAINRVARMVEEKKTTAPLEQLFPGVARNVLRESWRHPESRRETTDELTPSQQPAVEPHDLERKIEHVNQETEQDR
jgi:predicted nuclease of predicted toxin-antitoxin system